MNARYAYLATLALFLSPGCATSGEARHAATPPNADESGSRNSNLGGANVVRNFPTPPSEIAYIGDGVFGMSLIPGANRVDFEAHEKSPDNRLIYEWTMHGDTSFQVLAVCGRHANEYYICGAMDGALVLERWELVPWTTGAYYTERKSATEPIGTSVDAFRTFLRYRGPFVEPAMRTAPDLVRTTLSAPLLSGQVQELEVDPENRFLVFRTTDAQGASTLTQYELATGAVAVLGTPATHPLLTATACMRFLDSSELGRLLKVETTGLDILYLVDDKNDGVFERSLVLRVGEENYSALPESTLTLYP